MSIRRPPLQPLAFFEAAGRHLNFSAAARELGVTQSAVSHQVAWLEADLGVPLFRRLHRGVALTSEGARLFEVVRRGLDEIDGALNAIRVGRGRRVLTVATDFGFAAWWLMPRLAELRERMPDLEVRIVTSQDAIDIRRESIDVAVAFGTGVWPGCAARRLFPETVTPICGPGFRDRIGETADPDLLAGLPLLHLESSGGAAWLSWRDWFAHHGVSGRRPAGLDLTFNNYPLVLQAALMGQGVALGWSPLVDSLLRGGQLVALGQPLERADRGYFIVEAGDGAAVSGRGERNRDLFRNWILEEAARE
ncbi:choline sulfate utilization transcriptional regulator [Skermanella stibiiresistens]|uniref:choline sulfate utilization transcriptional regulator n=1 Tax=Skermanella stibiiresistens TaxID=913326 RepID=UPI0004AE25EF|nr:LysR substrate-binding domain-containing protein [Skermanella stibiiresistens]